MQKTLAESSFLQFPKNLIEPLELVQLCHAETTLA